MLARSVLSRGFFPALFSLGLMSCRDAPDEVVTGSGTDAGPTATASAAREGPRRPTRRYYMAKTPKGCEVYSVEGDVISAATRAPCPASIEIGERIRLAGRTCMREGAPQREQPVVCPNEVIDAEQQAREDAKQLDREEAERRARAEAEGKRRERDAGR